jgi:hypothetical protein
MFNVHVSTPRLFYLIIMGLANTCRDEHIVHAREQTKQLPQRTGRGNAQEEEEEEEATAFEKAYHTVEEEPTPTKGGNIS